MTASQRAIAAAQATVSKLTREGRSATAKTFEVSEGYVSQARALVDRAPDLAEAVKAGRRPLAEAYEDLRRRERASTNLEAGVALVKARTTASPETHEPLAVDWHRGSYGTKPSSSTGS